MCSPDAVLDFWYADAMRKQWFASTPALDAEIRQRFESTWNAARLGELDRWLDQAESALALIIVLDQFPLNMFRGEAKSFATEAQAIAAAKHAISLDYPRQIPRERVAFMYLPLMHSERLADQELCVRLFEAAGLVENARFARHHYDIVQRFGRFPHRNAILGRESTPDEIAYLNSKEAFKG